MSTVTTTSTRTIADLIIDKRLGRVDDRYEPWTEVEKPVDQLDGTRRNMCFALFIFCPCYLFTDMNLDFAPFTLIAGVYALFYIVCAIDWYTCKVLRAEEEQYTARERSPKTLFFHEHGFLVRHNGAVVHRFLRGALIPRYDIGEETRGEIKTATIKFRDEKQYIVTNLGTYPWDQPKFDRFLELCTPEALLPESPPGPSHESGPALLSSPQETSCNEV